MATTPKEGFGFVIRTNEYAGNFEREMCAFVTGRVGECEVGDKYVEPKVFEQAKKNGIDFENVMDVADDNGCFRPTSSTGPKYNDVAIFFEEKPSDKQIEFMKARAELFNASRKKGGPTGKAWKYSDSKIKILGFALEEYSRKVKSVKI
jgi:hypothetical protein